MKLTPQLKAKVAQAVQTTMRIEGYTTPRTESHRQSTRQQMERDRVQVSVRRKRFLCAGH